MKSNSQLGNPAGGSISEMSNTYKTSGTGSKVFKAQGYDDAKGINERFIDLNKASEGAPKINKPSHFAGGSVIKS